MTRNREVEKAMGRAMLAERPGAPDVSGDARPARRGQSSEIHINLRASKDDRDLIDRAAAVRHVTRTEFMLSSARSAAMDALLDQSFFKLDAAQWDAFIAALDASPKDNPRLKRLLARKAPWEK